MRKFIFVFVLPLFAHTLTAQISEYCIPDRFGEEPLFNGDDIEVINNIPYGLADFWYDGNVVPQLNSFDIAFPKAAVDDLSKRPFIALFHGGGFGAGDKTKLTNFMMEMAKRGYVAATFNYRLGWNTGGVEPSYCLGDPESLLGAYYRTCQDVNASMRYITYHASEYGIDTSMIFIGGQSAGMMGVMTNIYMSQQNINQIYPGLEDKYGKIDESTNSIDITYSVKGIINMWGAIPDTTFINSNENIPIINFYGERDNVVPPVSGPVQDCYSPNEYFTVYGSVSVYNRLSNLGICSILHANQITGHDAYLDEFTVPESACFLKSIICDNCTSGEFLNEISSCGQFVPIQENGLLENITVFPNPATGTLFISLGNASLPEYPILEIYDATGRAISADFNLDGSLIKLNITDMASGIYFGRIKVVDSIEDFRFVVNQK